MNGNKKILLLIITLLWFVNIQAQEYNNTHNTSDSSIHKEYDLADILHHIFQKKYPLDSNKISSKKYNFSFIPGFGYSLQTGWAGAISANVGFKTSNTEVQKISSITGSFTYSQYQQTIISLYSNIWSKNNNLNITSDIKFMHYPSGIFGLGGKIDPNQNYTINFTGIKFHQTVLKEFSNNFYAGIGYYYDHYWNIQALDSLKRNVAWRLKHKLGTEELASGIVLKFLYDSRINQINPKQGIYANLVYRANLKFLGSDEEWQSILSDVRAYFPFPKRSKNILAFWMFTWLTPSATIAPYLLIPSTGWDDSYNSGRGYIQGRFRGNNMYYFETEYRANLTRNGLLGGVLFCNLEAFSGDLSSTYTSLKPGYGFGVRLKLNKNSGANICLDYGFGQNGSSGIFVNIGEVF